MTKIGWSNDFIVLDGAADAGAELLKMKRSEAEWVLIDDATRSCQYVFSRREILELLARRHSPSGSSPAMIEPKFQKMPLAKALGLNGRMVSIRVAHSRDVKKIVPSPAYPSAARFIELDHGISIAVGGFDIASKRVPRDIPMAPPIRVDTGTHQRPFTVGAGPADTTAAAPAGTGNPIPDPIPDTGFQTGTSHAISDAGADVGVVIEGASFNFAAPSDTQLTPDDEGATPTRFPSISADGEIKSGESVTVVVDLLRSEDSNTLGMTLFPAQAPDWQRFEVDVLLQSPSIDFDHAGLGQLTVQRNNPTLAARLTGRVHQGLPIGSEIEVKAKFLLNTRFCGSAARRFKIDSGAAAATSQPTDALQATVQVDDSAEQPDITIFITVFDQDAPGKLHWRMVMPPFPNRPPKLDGIVNLGQHPAAQASQWFKQCANLERGSHREPIEGFGERLWRYSPPEFQAAYWALSDHLGRPLTIQFVSDDPHLPWELMSPVRDGEEHGPIALRHAVARWIGQWQGYMPNRLPKGHIVAIAPHYKSASTQLSQAENTVKGLVDTLGAQRVDGTRTAMLQLLEQPPDTSVALLYFTGHGAFAADSAGASQIKLEGGTSLTALEVARQKVKLGERYGTVVFLNACEVGATASVLGNVGGWADAFLSRKFGAFIAPLWAIDEEDATVVTEELMKRIVTDSAPIGAALRDLRKKYGDVSPTFYSYLLYGDVTARLGTA